MSESRNKILEAIQSSRVVLNEESEVIEQSAAELLTDSIVARPALLHDQADEAFVQRIQQGLVVGCSCHEIQHIELLPQAVAEYLSYSQLPPEIALQKVDQFNVLDWHGIDTDIQVESDGSVAVCLAESGIAETGSVVVKSSSDMPILMNFLSSYQIYVIERSQIMAYLDDFAVQEAARVTARNCCLITGASGTTDIEGVLVTGAHGPQAVHVIIVG
ncbi:MAG: LutC/YkgG family protein [Arenicella sp.]